MSAVFYATNSSERAMISAPNPELSQLVATFRALTAEDLTEPLLRKRRAAHTLTAVGAVLA